MKNSQIGRGIGRSSKTIKNDLKINELNQNMVYIKLDWILLLLINLNYQHIVVSCK